MKRSSSSALAAALALGCGAPEHGGRMPEKDPSVEIRAAARTVGTAIADGMTSSGYHTRRHEPYVLEFESHGALVHYSLSERTNATYVLAKVTPPEHVDPKDRSFRRYQLANEVQRFLDGVRSALEAEAAWPPDPPAAAPKDPRAPPPAPQPGAPSGRPGKALKKFGL